jgi:CubicO group peptidase (beta-lactamase class C family)
MHRLCSHALTFALALFGLVSQDAAGQTLGERLDRYLRQRPGRPFSGVVIVALGDSIVFERAYGMADADLGIPNRLETRFRIGSLTKPLTATAVMRLVETGQLRLTDRVCAYLARCPEAWRPVTLRHLLSHTSGIPDLFNELPAAPVDSTRAVMDAAVLRHLGDSLRSRPGERYAYSNFGYFLLGCVLEVAYHEPWERVLRDLVFSPASMRQSVYDDVWAIMPGRAHGYALKGDSLRNIAYKDHAAYAAGGLLSSAPDLFSFDRALSHGKLIADSTLREMTQPGLGDYGLGWQVIRVFGRRMRNHTGGIDGFASHLATYDDGTTVIVLSNVEDEAAKATACDVAAIRFGIVISPPGEQRDACRAVP